MQTYCDGYDYYCEFCADENCEPLFYAYCDSPIHCSKCRRPLDYSLTNDGVNYVLNALKEELSNPMRMESHPIYNGTWYEDSPHMAIVADWAEHLRWYGLEGEQEEILETFWEEWLNS